jgi:hypothetical protein
VTEEKVISEADGNPVNIVIHTASSLDQSLALNLLAGLAAHQKTSGRKSYFIQVSSESSLAMHGFMLPEY